MTNDQRMSKKRHSFKVPDLPSSRCQHSLPKDSCTKHFPTAHYEKSNRKKKWVQNNSQETTRTEPSVWRRLKGPLWWPGGIREALLAKIMEVIVSQTLLPRMGLGALPGYAPWRTQSPSLGCHKGAFSGPPTPLRAQPETQAQPWCGYLPHLLFLLKGARSNCLTAGGSVLISVLHKLSEWLLALWFCFIAPLGHGYSKSWTRPGTQLLWHGLQATGGTQLFLSRPLRCGCREWCHTHGQISHPSCPKQKPQNWSLLFQSHLLRGGWRSHNITSQVSLLSQIFLKWSCCSVTKSKIVKASDNWKDGWLLPGHILLV